MWLTILLALAAAVFVLEEVVAVVFRRWYYTHGLVMNRLVLPVQAELGEPTPRELELQFRLRLPTLDTVKLWPLDSTLLAFRYAYPLDVIGGYIRFSPAPQAVTVCVHLDFLSVWCLSLLIIFFCLSGWELAVVPTIAWSVLSLLRRRRQAAKLAAVVKAIWEAPIPSTGNPPA